MSWEPSPSGSVWRKRLHRVGGAETGQVTAIVRYDANSSFPAHDHPGGEEILVLEGVFSDEHGDWPAGTYLLNPEGFRHAPFSKDGCLIFVKLRQYDGAGRKHVALRTHQMRWMPSGIDGIEIKPLYADPTFADSTRLERWLAGTSPGKHFADGGFELFVLDGELRDETGSYPAGSWLRLPAGASHTAHTESGCVLYRKTGALPNLQSRPSRNLKIRTDN